MPSDEPISLSMIATIATIAASATAVAGTAYSLSQGTPKAPSVPEVPAPPPPAPPETGKPVEAPAQAPDLTKPVPTAEESARASESALALRRRQGRASTILTGPSGLYSTTATSSPLKTLLGA